MIHIKLPEEDIKFLKDKFSSLQNQAAASGLTLNENGTFHGKGLEGKFSFTEDSLDVDITEKPFGVFDWMVKKHLLVILDDVLR